MPRDRSGGFTLLELMIVLAILSLGVALAFPSLMGRHQASSLAGAAQQTRAALAAARSAAIAEDRAVVYRADAAAAPITFYPSGGSSGGRIVLRSGSAEREIEVEPLTGRAVLR